MLPSCRSLLCSYDIGDLRLPRSARNGYMYVSRVQAIRFGLHERPNYGRSARVIQRSYRKRVREKYKVVVGEYLFSGPAGVVSLYLC